MISVGRSATVVLSGTALSVAGALVGGPATAAERVVQIDRDGVRPQVLQVEPGDTVRFVSEDPTFAYRAQSTGGPWRFDSGPTALLQGDFVVPSALTRPGRHSYRVAQDAPFTGSVVVAAAVPAVPSAAGPSAAVPSAATPAPAVTVPLVPVPASPVPAPPVLTPPVTGTPAPVAAPAVRGPLPAARSDRALGLAVALAVVLLVGAGSLLLRLLLALPPGPEHDGTRPPRW